MGIKYHPKKRVMEKAIPLKKQVNPRMKAGIII
jgi:hypothetical protein